MLTYPVCEGEATLRRIPTLTTLQELPTVTGEQYALMFMWLPAILQDVYGILSEPMTLVSISSDSAIYHRVPCVVQRLIYSFVAILFYTVIPDIRSRGSCDLRALEAG